ncbi:MAG: hypothetical protein CVV23_00770 [Ignavibacteriae bacterium HGW-Ignavibacteriae-2]|jgi:hypothetical protein|nr:MAG: hypothetical protein CVV23_00770 [Ignavibacteriae bacterium HGW-Ignavibacteriae-2]
MVRKITLSLLFILLAASTSLAQWNNVGGKWAFTNDRPDTIRGQIHGLAVDPDGKIWTQPWATINVPTTPGDTVKAVYALRVFNPDGTEASFSPVYKITTGGGFIEDTLYGSVISNPRGLRTDHEGNILAIWGKQTMYRINYKTGEGMNKVELGLGTSPAAPAVDAQGRIYVAPVVPGNPIQIYNPDFTFVGNAVEQTSGFARTVVVSKDGNTIYHCGYSNGYITVFQRPNVFSSYDSVGTILNGFHSETAEWDPKSGLLYASAGSFNDKAEFGYSNNTFYGYDIVNKAIVDSFKWVFNVPANSAERFRGMGFSPDGNKAYAGIFGTGGFPIIQQWHRVLDPVEVTLNVDMTVQITEGLFNPATGKVSVAGSFNGYDVNATVMTDPDGDKIYSAKIAGIEPGTRLFFKYASNGNLEDALTFPNNGNRELVVTSGNNKALAYFNDYLGAGINVNFTFRCDMELEILKGNFNPSTDILSVRGSFNNYAKTDVLTATANPNIYELVLPIQVKVDDVLTYRYGYATTSADVVETDKVYTVKQEDVTNASVIVTRGFNGIKRVDVTEQEVTLLFQLNMKKAINDVTKQAFESIQNVVIAGDALPLRWPGAGWPSEDNNKVKFLNDNGENGDMFRQDSIWGVTLKFPLYTVMNFKYKYGANWGLPSNGGSNDNESSTGVLHVMTLNKGIQSATVFDTWADMSPAKLDSIVADVREISNYAPSSYSLDQNYPNPFNPTTNIRFALQKANKVTLKVYNILGQEVATLLNEFKNAGVYEVNFDASKLSSGVYVYSITTGDFASFKKMMLIK